MTDENKELHELALKGLKYVIQMEFKDSDSKSRCFIKIK